MDVWVPVNRYFARVFLSGSGKTSDTRDISSITIETVEKKQGATMKKRFHGDATKVVLKGNGLKKAFQNRPGTFNIDVNGAGKRHRLTLFP